MRVALVNVGFMPHEADLRPAPPFGIMQLGAYLRETGHDVQLFDWSGEELDDEKRDTLRSARAEVVGVHVKVSSAIVRAMEVSRWAREDGAKVVWGGPGPTTLPHECLRDAPVDVVVLGEGEITTAELLDTLERGGELGAVRGIAFRRDRKTVRTTPRQRIADLDALPLPWWEGLGDLSRYHVPLHGRSAVPLVTSRGCVGSCGFCYARGMWGGKWIGLSPKRVVESMEHVMSLDPAVGGFLLIDDLFYAQQGRVREICRMIKERGLDLVWNCEVRADMIDPDLLRVMRGAGCRQVLMGVETGSPRLLNLANKNITVDRIREAARALHEADIEIYAMLVNGLPGETEEDLAATEQLLREIRPEYTEFSTYMPYPGTPLYPQALASGWEPPRTLAEWGELGTFDISAVDRKGLTQVPGKTYRDLARRTKRRAVVRSYVQAVTKDPLSAPARGMRFLFKRDEEGG